jgi:hypothetical protein
VSPITGKSYHSSMTTILSQMGLDRFQASDEIVTELRKLYGGRGRLEVTRRSSRFGQVYAAWVVAKVEEGPIVIDHPLDHSEHAELEWWQQDHLLTGFGCSASMAEAVDQAMASARRGKLELVGLTLWRDRVAGVLRLFRRSPRGENYQPTGDELTREAFENLLQ